LKNATSLRACQFVQEGPEHVIVRAVSSNGTGPEEMMQIRTQLEKLLGPSMRVTAEIATQPVVLPGGKTPLIINRIRRPQLSEPPQPVLQ
jgi:hypothetical protein